MIKFFRSIFSLFIIMAVLLVFSCGSEDNPENRLSTYCVRLCVADTGDPEICDTQCRCAAHDISNQYTDEGLSEFMHNLTRDENEQNEYTEKLKNSLELCKNASQ